MGEGLHSCRQIIQTTRLGGKYGHQLPGQEFFYCLQNNVLLCGPKPVVLSIFQHLQLSNARGHILRCSHYLPSPFPEDSSLPCVIYCHGNRYVIVIIDNFMLLLLYFFSKKRKKKYRKRK